MWRDMISGFTINCTFFAPATEDDLMQVEAAINVKLPTDLRELLNETNGVLVSPSFPDCEDADLTVSLLWSSDEILKENAAYREFEKRFTGFLLFASQPNGDPIAFPVTHGVADSSAIVMIPHDDTFENRRVIAGSLQDYLAEFLGFVAARERGEFPDT